MKKGSVTIYFSIIMLSIMLIISAVLEAARVRATKAECTAFVHLAADSVMAGYAKQLYEEYGVLLVWENQPVEETLKSNMQANINMADLNETGNGLMGTNLNDIKVKNIGYVTDNNGEEFAKQLLSYVKYGISL